MSSKDNYDVVISGAGPVGLWVACELGMAGVSTVILEKKQDPLSDPWVMGTLGVRAINHAAAEILYRRGLLTTVFKPRGPAKRTELRESIFVGHYAGCKTDPSKVDFAKWRHILPAPTADAFGGAAKGGPLVEALTKRALSLGTEIVYGCEVSNYEETEAGIKVWTASHTDGDSDSETAAKQSQTYITAKYLVGCDGGRSSVRHGGDFEFIGSEATWTGYSIHCTLADPEVLVRGFNRTTNGMYFRSPGMGPFDEGLYYFIDVDGGVGRNVEPSLEHVQGVMRKVSGRSDLIIKEAHLMGSFTDRTKQAMQYRQGRVFLAGDACHIHAPIGGQGLNLGLGDAINLGWKLIAAVKGRAADVEALLDSYGAERIPLGKQVLDHTRVQTLGVTPGLHGQAIYNFVTGIGATPDGATFLAERVNWYDRKLDLGSDHWLVGRSAPDFEFVDGSRLGQKLERGNWVIVDFARNAEIATFAKSLGLEYTDAAATETLSSATVVVRPDGVVAWASDEPVDVSHVERAVGKWLKIDA